MPSRIAPQTGRGKALSDGDKWAIVHSMRDGARPSDVAQQLGCTRHTVYKYWQRFLATQTVNSIAKRGRKRTMSSAVDELALDMLTIGSGSTADRVVSRMCTEGHLSKPVHKATLIRGARRAAVAAGTKLWVQRGKPAKGLTDASKAKRLAFALANKDRDWSNVMFTDRKKFHFRYPGSSIMPTKWVKGPSKQLRIKVYQPNHTMCVNLYAGITNIGVTTVHLVAGTSKYKTHHTNKQGKPAKNITTGQYKEVLQQTLLTEGRRLHSTAGRGTWVLQQDNDPTHKCATKILEQWNEKHGSSVQLLEAWPPNSPDLNLIENFWAWVQQKVDQMGCKDFEEFKKAVIDTIAAVPQQYLTNLYNGMKARLEEVIEKEGDLTRH